MFYGLRGRQARITEPIHCSTNAGFGVNSSNGVFMKRVGWLQKLCLGSCVNAKERDNRNALAVGEPLVGAGVLRSRATIAEATGANAIAAAALGALAVGGLAVGCLVIGRLIIREMLIQRVHLRRLKIDQLEVEELRVGKLSVLKEQSSAGGQDNPPTRQV
jgi:hypothetical protein